MLKNLGGPGMRYYEDAKAEGMVEPGILPLTEALFEAGAFPLSSCEGHTIPEDRSLGRLVLKPFFDLFLGHLPAASFRPFVMFSAPEGYARAFVKCYSRYRGFHYCWRLIGHFDPEFFDLVWIIEPLDIRLAEGKVDRALALADISSLAAVAREAAEESLA